MPENNVEEVVQATPEEINMYDFNKVNMAQIEPLDVISLKRLCIDAMRDFAIGSYWMLLNRELYDYTLFVNNGELNEVGRGEALFATLTNRGKVVDFTKQPQDNGVYEIWVRIPTFDPATGEQGTADVVYYLFNYDTGIVEV